MKNKNSKFKTSKEISTYRKNKIRQDLNSRVEEVEKDRLQKEILFKAAKKLRYYDYLIIVGFSLFYILLSFLLDKYVIKKETINFEFLTTLGGFVSLFIAMINGFIRNRQSAKFYNDSRKRYESTLEESEGLSRRISKILLLIALILILTSVILWIIWAT